jgi:hypothetical protein
MGSPSTIVGRTIAARMGWLEEARKCGCRMTTVTGAQEESNWTKHTDTNRTKGSQGGTHCRDPGKDV